jgi:mRNA-degrading endonuclease RelE of RelBE toxin-antitoxin system
MGGYGSGSWYRWNVKRKAEESLPVDIRFLKKHGYLDGDNYGALHWSRGGNRYASISFYYDNDRIVLSYTYNKTEDVRQEIEVTTTPCNYGGVRKWFICPTCNRRCAVVYSSGRYFECRVCCNLNYTSQCESDMYRLSEKANKLRKRLGAEPGIINSLPHEKPKHMHMKTYVRLMNEIERLEYKSDRLFIERFNNLKRKGAT